MKPKPNHECARCARLGKKRKADYVFDVENNRGITVIYMYMCRNCLNLHSFVTRDRYKPFIMNGEES